MVRWAWIKSLRQALGFKFCNLCMFLYRNPDKTSTFVMKSPGIWKILRMDFKAWNLLHEDVCQILQKHKKVIHHQRGFSHKFIKMLMSSLRSDPQVAWHYFHGSWMTTKQNKKLLQYFLMKYSYWIFYLFF